MRVALKCIKQRPYTVIYGFHIQQFIAFSKTDEFFSLGNVDNLSFKPIAADAEFSGYKNGEPVQNTLENDINDPEPRILTT